MDNHEAISHEEQIERWVRGESVHRIHDGVLGGSCTPDFSCCKPELLAEPAVRQAFAAANERDRVSFLGAFLGAALALVANEIGAPRPAVHIAGRDPRDES